MLPRPYDPTMRLAAAAVVALALAGTASASVIVSFRTPSGNIGCYYSSGLGPRADLRCDIRSGLKPLPRKPGSCDLDWGDSYDMGPTGTVHLVCHGDTAINPKARVLRYGGKWTRGGFTCASKTEGLRCTNRSGHGFFLSRAHSYRF